MKAESAPTICGRFFSKVAIVGASAQLTSVAPGKPAVAGGRDHEEDAAISVLLIEDNEGDAYLVSESLANSQPPRFKITHRDRLSSGLACLSNESFDLILVDLSLPDSNGFETFRRVRESSPSIPIVVLTGLDDQDLAIKTAREGGQDYLLKQFTGGELLKRLMRQAIDRKRKSKKLSRRPILARMNSWRCSPTNCGTPWPRWNAVCRCSARRTAKRATESGP